MALSPSWSSEESSSSTWFHISSTTFTLSELLVVSVALTVEFLTLCGKDETCPFFSFLNFWRKDFVVNDQGDPHTSLPPVDNHPTDR